MLAIVVPKLFDYSKNNEIIYGGGERYALDLAKLTVENEIYTHILQPSINAFSTEYDGVSIKGIESCCKVGPIFPDETLNPIQKELEKYDKVIYLSHHMVPTSYKPGIVISHGIYMDYPMPPQAKNLVIKQIGNSLKYNTLISVDDNTINTYRVLYGNAFRYYVIKNYADLSIFIPTEKQKEFTLLFCRRLDYERGWNIAQQAFHELVKQNINIVICGNGQYKNEALKLQEKYKDNVVYMDKPFNKVIEAYQIASASLIPTICSEGTSFTALESLACGVPLISTAVGGLSEIIRDKENGYVIRPTADDIFNKVMDMAHIYKTHKYNDMVNNCINQSAYNQKILWKNKWLQVFEEMGW
jgi:glycosyltransferase involved in cell wall biosynthesis